ncbi:sugar isomerase domain-containing protein [Sporosarcina sp. BI001-red]|uniref:SIS domain-containing protein n=1 Tax=Sporosarcina sp. BI001-red TaxID=2282866 RepID=UPI000E237BBB|nr:SIS domain-containing protein [Sporosarcina sp. BI001-red]REB08011.1 sugar isomerase domain-containing protein [Sporosarcina sp. BI001-red]
MNSYISEITALITEAGHEAKGAVEQAAAQLADRIAEGGIIHLFGSGHSQLLAQEGFFRAGSLACVQPISIGPLMLHEGALLSSKNEKDPEFSKTFLTSLDIRPEDVVIIISNSGRNPVPIDMAEYANTQGAYTVSIQSLLYTEKEHPSRHSSSKRLEALVSTVLDTKVLPGDGIMHIDGIQCGPASSVIGNALLHALFCEVVVRMSENGMEPPVFKSGNIEGNDTHNNALVAHYSDRIDF